MKYISPKDGDSPRFNLFKLVSSLIPPAVKEILGELRNHGTLRFFRKTFIGSFKSFEDVSRSFSGVVPYNSDESEKEEVLNAEKFRLAAEKAKQGTPPESTDRQTFLCSLVSAFPSPEVTILDVGGGVGHSLAHLIYSCIEKKINLIIFELPAVVSIGRSVFKDVPGIEFVDDLKKIKSKINLVFFGSSLQYFEDYESIFREIKSLNPEVIALSYTPTTPGPTFVTAQVNMRRRIIPAKIINFQEIVSFLDRLGFNLSYQSVSLTSVNFKNFSYPQSASFFSNLVFKKKK